MIERTYRGVDPQPTITAPLPLPRDGHSESVRLATFRQSFATRNGVVAPFPPRQRPRHPLAAVVDRAFSHHHAGRAGKGIEVMSACTKSAEANSRFQVIDTAKPVGDTRITIDPATGLQWQTVCYPKKVTFDESAKIAREFRLGGFDDWRVPSRAEANTIVDDTRCNPAIDTVAFPDATSDGIWTSTPYAGNPSDCAWVQYFHSGHSYIYDRSSRFPLRLVRGPSRQ